VLAHVATFKRPQRAKKGKRRFLKRIAAALLAFILLSVLTFAIFWFVFPFPLQRLDGWPASPQVMDRDGRVLLQRVSDDQQWRLPVPLARMSPWLLHATVAVEDRRFYSHWGVDPWAVLRAAGQDIRSRRIVSGASTLTMQICRMMDDRPRTLWAKAVESFRALQLERLKSKDEILEMYLNVAPYGRNLRGVEAASQAYFGKRAADLSLGEAALLAGLPQSPARYRPDRYPQVAKARRDVVLGRMVEMGMITADQQALASAEPIAMASPPHRNLGYHAAFIALGRRRSGGRTTLDSSIQAAVQRAVGEHIAAAGSQWPSGADVSVVVIDIESSDIVALVGSANPAEPVSGQVCGATAWRSPGSALKPFIYAAAFESRRLRADSPVYDVPIERASWAPENFDHTFSGKVTVAEALRRSLNVPAILTAEGVGLPQAIGTMQACGVRFVSPARVRGGLAVAVGAVEVRLVDLTAAYATIGRGGAYCPPRLMLADQASSVRVLSPETCAALGDILSSRHRRPHGMEDRPTTAVPWFMWKTGTSSHRRDAWAVGHNGRYAIGVWAGRFGGSRNDQLLGAETAEPLLAKMFDLPALRAQNDPPPATSWQVLCPLPEPRELAGPLRIISPSNGAAFRSLAGRAIVRPTVNHESNTLTWFLNGAALDAGRAQRLVLAPGSYSLRCAGANGEASAIRFSVR
jgi:penicillin-binding protein 1C